MRGRTEGRSLADFYGEVRHPGRPVRPSKLNVAAKTCPSRVEVDPRTRSSMCPAPGGLRPEIGLGEPHMSAYHFTGRGLRRHVARTGPANLPEQDEETVLVLWGQIRPAPPGLQRQVTNLAALIGRESIPILPTLRVQPKDRGEDSAPRDLPNGSDGLQDPGWHRCRCDYPAPGTSNGAGFPALEGR